MKLQPTKGSDREDRRGPGRPSNPISREEIVRIARGAFASSGYSGTSLRDIATAARLRKSSLYHHFSTKEALYGAVLDGIVLDLRQLILDAGAGPGAHAERLDRLGGRVVEYLAERPEAARLLLLEVLGAGPYVRGAGWEAIRANLEVTAAFLQGGIDAGAFLPQDARQLALSIIGLHLFYFGAHDASSVLLGRDIFDGDVVSSRKGAILAQVRALCVGTAADGVGPELGGPSDDDEVST